MMYSFFSLPGLSTGFGRILNTQVAFFSGLSNKRCGIKNPYYRKKGLWEWRKMLIYRLNKNRYSRKFITPKKVDKEEMPIKSKESARVWEFKVEELPISLKRLRLYSKLLTNLHLQDAIDWLTSFPNIKTNRILNSMSESQKKIFEEHGGDPSRLYIDNIIINYSRPIKQLKHHALGNFGIMCTWRNTFKYKIREMPMNEFYQKIFILGKVPKSMSSEMRNAIYDKRVNSQNIAAWFPYLTAHSRFIFRKNLRFLNKIGKFDYYSHRKDWINQYNENLDK
ncbi:hypothetical protein MACJ_000098 [Theileria orientalis]|uniref:50S ribosomal protein L22, mitochondrial n=1 Tax=Theileria orientalis TaxID=68886 RepID=A0A976QRE6_THEOR|nr:hypothetical protein MACJ_000098 [Theileria orientalis]